MRTRCFATLFVLVGFAGPQHLPAARAQSAAQTQADAAADNRIAADSAPYRMEWSGTSGVFIRKAFGGEPEVRQPMSFLHTDAGPAGFAKHLAWFLARDNNSFSLLWCYLNDSGTEFDCWTYRYPSNQLTSLHFTGTYRFSRPPEPAPAVPLPDLKLPAPPPYAGPDFSYRDWTRVAGALNHLDLKLPKQTAAATADTGANTGAVVRTISQILVRPLHHVEVGDANGWREGGWRELHAIAYDSALDPFYLILYSNTNNGYVLDLKRSQIYTTDFGAKVSFPDDRRFGPENNPLDIEPEIKVRRFDRHEIVLTTHEKIENPYTDVQVGVEFKGPDAKPILVPGFWDGGGTYRVRFAPTTRGIWTWRSLSKTTGDINGETGNFECIAEETGEKGFVNVQPVHHDTRHFSYASDDAFLPVLVREPQPTFTTMSSETKAGLLNRSTLQLTGLQTPAAPDSSATFLAYQKFISSIARKGFNRLVGGALLGPAATRLVRANEGGPACVGPDINNVNPAFFQWMDRRVAYCNARGIVPDIGIGTLQDALLTTYQPRALYALWAYVVARYAAFNVQWTLFEPGDSAPSAAAQNAAEQFAELTRLYDPNHHPITVVAAGGAAVPAAAAPDREPTSRGPRRASTATSRATGSALAETGPPKKPPVRYDLQWEDVITVIGGDVSSLPDYTGLTKPMVMLERATTTADTALTPDVTRHRMWEARMRGAYWAPGQVPSVDPAAPTPPEIQWAAYCGDLFRRTRFYRLAPRPEMLGGPSESAADRKRRKRAEAEAARKNPPPAADEGVPLDFDPLSPDPLPALPAPPPPKPMFVLADPAKEYVVYFEEGGTLLLDLLEATGKVNATWFNPRTGEFGPTNQIVGGAYVSFSAPDANDWVLYVSRRFDEAPADRGRRD